MTKTEVAEVQASAENIVEDKSTEEILRSIWSSEEALDAHDAVEESEPEPKKQKPESAKPAKSEVPEEEDDDIALADEIFGEKDAGSEKEEAKDEDSEGEDSEATGEDDDEDGDDVDEDVAKSMTKKQAEAFAKAKYERKQERKLRKELERQLAEQVENNAEDELKKLQEKIKEQDEKIARLNLQESDEFKSTYTLPIVHKLNKAASMLVREGMSEADAKRLLMNQRNADPMSRARRLNEESPLFGGALINIFEEIDELETKRRKALSAPKQEQKRLSAQSSRQTERQRTEAIEQTLPVVAESLVSEGNVFFNTAKGSDEKAQAWNKRVADRLDIVKGVVLNNDVKEVTKYVADGVAAPLYRKEIRMLRKRLAEYREKEVPTRRPPARTPGPGGGSGGGAVATNGSKSKNKSNEEILRDIWEK